MRVFLLCCAIGAAMTATLGCSTASHRPILSASAGEPIDGKVLVNVDENGVALQGGYDPVAFFTEKKPVKGDPAHRLAYKGATYHFASAANKAAFEKNPAAYEPQFGGYCAYAASINKVSPIDVKYFEIVNGRLILQHNQKAWDLWHQDSAGNLPKADNNWPELVQRHGS